MEILGVSSEWILDGPISIRKKFLASEASSSETIRFRTEASYHHTLSHIMVYDVEEHPPNDKDSPKQYNFLQVRLNPHIGCTVLALGTEQRVEGYDHFKHHYFGPETHQVKQWGGVDIKRLKKELAAVRNYAK